MSDSINGNTSDFGAGLEARLIITIGLQRRWRMSQR
jgi:hypothetical protein